MFIYFEFPVMTSNWQLPHVNDSVRRMESFTRGKHSKAEQQTEQYFYELQTEQC